jgi:hypothetical protein
MTTFIYPAELYPVEVRTTAHGISAAAGKLSAFAGAYLFPTSSPPPWASGAPRSWPPPSRSRDC